MTRDYRMVLLISGCDCVLPQKRSQQLLQNSPSFTQMPEPTAVLHVIARGFDDAEKERLLQIMDEHEFWYWGGATGDEGITYMDDGIAVISEAFADTEDNKNELDQLVETFDEEFESRVIDVSKMDQDRPQAIIVPTSFVYDITIGSL